MTAESSTDTAPFAGFDRPTYTQVPDQLFDELLPRLREAELKALLYIIRRTFGFKKDRDAISYNQFLRGIRTRDGQCLDEGCGVRDRTTLSRALRSLEEKRIIVSQKGEDERGENETTIYSLRFRDLSPKPEKGVDVPGGGVVGNTYHGGRGRPQGVVGDSYQGSRDYRPRVVGDAYQQETQAQQTVTQETEQQQESTNCAGPASERGVVVALVERGVTRKVAERLARDFPADSIFSQLDMLEYRNAKDPARLLVKAIREDWAPPAGYEPPRVREERARREAEQAGDRDVAAEERRRHRESWRERVISRHAIDGVTLEAWGEAQRLLPRLAGARVYERHFERALMLPPGSGRVTVVCESYAQAYQAGDRERQALEMALAGVLGRKVEARLVWEA